MNNQDLLNKKDAFIARFGTATDQIKKQVHYQSVVNMTAAIVTIENGAENTSHKQNLFKYFQEVERLEFPTDKITSLKLYQTYLHSMALHLMSNANFRSASDFRRAIIWGVILDLILFWIFSSIFGYVLPVFTLFFGVKAYNENKIALKENRYFGRQY